MFGVPHLVAVVATVCLGSAMIALNRSAKVQEQIKRRANVALAWLLLVSVAVDPLLTWMRFGENPQEALRIIREITLPLFLCDVVSILLAIAIIQGRQRFAEIGYLWGIAGTVQGLITPTLTFSWCCPEYYVFFLQHGGVPIAALVVVCSSSLRPQPRAFRRAVYWSWGYMAVVFCFNLALDANYGFLNGKPPSESLFDFMGEYPWYLITLQVIAFTLYYLLLLPFSSKQKSRNLRHDST
jgi:hypothetical integral membrane protein (TIGR02206 family)